MPARTESNDGENLELAQFLRENLDNRIQIHQGICKMDGKIASGPSPLRQ
jgi:hypothetical protein